jgi:hypothetical protein
MPGEMGGTWEDKLIQNFDLKNLKAVGHWWHGRAVKKWILNFLTQKHAN